MYINILILRSSECMYICLYKAKRKERANKCSLCALNFRLNWLHTSNTLLLKIIELYSLYLVTRKERLYNST